MDKRITCKNCGAQLDIEASNGDSQTLCLTCQRLPGTYYPADLVSLIDDEPSIVSVCIVWNDRETKSDQVACARRAFPELAKVQIGNLLQEVRQSSKYDLGTFVLPVAIELQEKGKKFGLVLTIQ